jgi:type IX secretion system PorP/SprF family membrane protein
MIGLRYITIVVVSLILTSSASVAQDIHFSQWFFAPQILSPAEIGNFPAQYRINANQKSQWKQVSRPFTTFAISADAHHEKLPQNVAVGIVLMNDRAGDSKLNTFSFLVGGSYTYKPFGTDNHLLRGAVQLGITQIKLDYGDLSFNNQHNGVVYDPNLSSGENFARNSRWYANVNLGIGYTWAQAARKAIHAGWSLHNLNRPDQSFFNDVGVDLPMRHGLYAYSSWMGHEDWDVMPAISLMRQGAFTEFIIGSAARYILIDERGMYRSIFAGYFGRVNDSGIAMVGVEVDAWRFATSYDINVSELTPASRNRGGLEFSLQYLFNRTDRTRGFQHKFCPVYL